MIDRIRERIRFILNLVNPVKSCLLNSQMTAVA